MHPGWLAGRCHTTVRSPRFAAGPSAVQPPSAALQAFLPADSWRTLGRALSNRPSGRQLPPTMSPDRQAAVIAAVLAIVVGFGTLAPQLRGPPGVEVRPAPAAAPFEPVLPASCRQTATAHRVACRRAAVPPSLQAQPTLGGRQPSPNTPAPDTRQQTPLEPPPKSGSEGAGPQGCAADVLEELRERLASMQRRLVSAEQSAQQKHEADARALAAELEARKQVCPAQRVGAGTRGVPPAAELPFGLPCLTRPFAAPLPSSPAADDCR